MLIVILKNSAEFCCFCFKSKLPVGNEDVENEGQNISEIVPAEQSKDDESSAGEEIELEQDGDNQPKQQNNFMMNSKIDNAESNNVGNKADSIYNDPFVKRNWKEEVKGRINSYREIWYSDMKRKEKELDTSLEYSRSIDITFLKNNNNNNEKMKNKAIATLKEVQK